MRLTLHDPAYTDRLAAFLRSLGQRPVIHGPDRVDLNESDEETDRAELEIYLRVWRVLYPDAAVDLAFTE
jgi:hypothetical protein